MNNIKIARRENILIFWRYVGLIFLLLAIGAGAMVVGCMLCAQI